MAIPSRTALPGTSFVTSVTQGRRRIFQRDASCELFLNTLQHYRLAGNYKLHAFVMMPDHIHLLLTPQSVSLERAVGLIKGGFSRRLESAFPVWQRGFTDHRVRDRDDYLTRLDYIHQNPVAARLAVCEANYRYSSAYRGGFERMPSAAEAAFAGRKRWHG